jgi:archaemetzincin
MRYFSVLIPLVLVCAYAMKFKPPDEIRRQKAIGPTAELAQTLQRAFEAADDFEPMPSPGPGDWLAVHPEIGQTFEGFVKSKPNRPDNVRSTIYLQPLGSFTEGRPRFLEELSSFAAAYFALPVRVLPTIRPDKGINSRINPYTKKPQLLTSDILGILKDRLPEDAFCLLAITMADLYPDESWNFVFGQASLRSRVAVYSFARYDPVFYGRQRSADYDKLLLRRSCKVLAHETAHMFGLTHCIYFHCVINGSNHLAESDARPMRLCPVCLRKLHHSTGFDVVTRYRRLQDFYNAADFKDEAGWVKRRLDFILRTDNSEKATEQKD